MPVLTRRLKRVTRDKAFLQLQEQRPMTARQRRLATTLTLKMLQLGGIAVSIILELNMEHEGRTNSRKWVIDHCTAENITTPINVKIQQKLAVPSSRLLHVMQLMKGHNFKNFEGKHHWLSLQQSTFNALKLVCSISMSIPLMRLFTCPIGTTRTSMDSVT